MKKFEILPHTADMRLKVFGKTEKELFQNALAGMAEILKKEAKRPKKAKAKIAVKSPDINSLLVDFLSEVLYQSQINKAVYRDVKFLKFSNPSINLGQAELEAEISGFKVEEFDEDIKAVTYHELNIKKSTDSKAFETIIIFDI